MFEPIIPEMSLGVDRRERSVMVKLDDGDILFIAGAGNRSTTNLLLSLIEQALEDVSAATVVLSMDKSDGLMMPMEIPALYDGNQPEEPPLRPHVLRKSDEWGHFAKELAEQRQKTVKVGGEIQIPVYLFVVGLDDSAPRELAEALQAISDQTRRLKIFPVVVTLPSSEPRKSVVNISIRKHVTFVADEAAEDIGASVGYLKNAFESERFTTEPYSYDGDLK